MCMKLMNEQSDESLVGRRRPVDNGDSVDVK